MGLILICYTGVTSLASVELLLICTGVTEGEAGLKSKNNKLIVFLWIHFINIMYTNSINMLFPCNLF